MVASTTWFLLHLLNVFSSKMQKSIYSNYTNMNMCPQFKVMSKTVKLCLSALKIECIYGQHDYSFYNLITEGMFMKILNVWEWCSYVPKALSMHSWVTLFEKRGLNIICRFFFHQWFLKIRFSFSIWNSHTIKSI